MTAGLSHSCGLRNDSSIVCWGENSRGQTDALDSRFSAVAAGWVHSAECARTARLPAGQQPGRPADVPDDRFSAVAAGWAHSCGVRIDGAVACWGDNSYGQTDAPDGTFTAVTAGEGHSCGLRTDGTVECWGGNKHGQADAPDGTFTAVTAGEGHSCGAAHRRHRGMLGLGHRTFCRRRHRACAFLRVADRRHHRLLGRRRPRAVDCAGGLVYVRDRW